MKKIKLILAAAALLALTIGLAGCNGTVKTTKEEHKYPYMEYFEEKAKTLWFEEDGYRNPTMDQITGDDLIEPDSPYLSVSMYSKALMHIKSVTFCVSAQKNCKILLYASGRRPENSPINSGCYIEKDRKMQLTSLEAGKVYTFTIEMYEIVDGQRIDNGIYDGFHNEQGRKQSFAIGYNLYKNTFIGIDNFYDYREPEKYIEAGVKFSKISMQIEKLEVK